MPFAACRVHLRSYVAYERSVFNKLTLAYVLNTALLPLAVGLLPMGISQAWYEEGGLVSQSISLMIASGIGFSLFQAVTTDCLTRPRPLICVIHIPPSATPASQVQPIALIKRHVFGRFALSQPQIDRLYDAPNILFAKVYASVVKSLAICLIYAPLWPPAYLLTAFLLLFAYICCRISIAHWYARPPPFNQTLFNDMYRALIYLLFAHVGVVHIVYQEAVSSHSYDNVRLLTTKANRRMHISVSCGQTCGQACALYVPQPGDA